MSSRSDRRLSQSAGDRSACTSSATTVPEPHPWTAAARIVDGQLSYRAPIESDQGDQNRVRRLASAAAQSWRVELAALRTRNSRQQRPSADVRDTPKLAPYRIAGSALAVSYPSPREISMPERSRHPGARHRGARAALLRLAKSRPDRAPDQEPLGVGTGGIRLSVPGPVSDAAHGRRGREDGVHGRRADCSAQWPHAGAHARAQLLRRVLERHDPFAEHQGLPRGGAGPDRLRQIHQARSAAQPASARAQHQDAARLCSASRRRRWSRIRWAV